MKVISVHNKIVETRRHSTMNTDLSLQKMSVSRWITASKLFLFSYLESLLTHRDGWTAYLLLPGWVGLMAGPSGRFARQGKVVGPYTLPLCRDTKVHRSCQMASPCIFLFVLLFIYLFFLVLGFVLSALPLQSCPQSLFHLFLCLSFSPSAVTLLG
jgi:hypothetical protein